MRYQSTRGEASGRGFSDILLEGLAPDGGLYLPERYLRHDAGDARRAGAACHTLRTGVRDLLALRRRRSPAQDLRISPTKTQHAAEVFCDSRIVPLRRLEPGLFVLGLSNGPTLAFKDMAMQFLGKGFEYELARRGRTARRAWRDLGRHRQRCRIRPEGQARHQSLYKFSPLGCMSEFQQAQMYSLEDANIHNLAVEGVFDDCQDLVKGVSADLDFKARYAIGTVNSINWARLLAQVVYYFAAYFQATPSGGGEVDFAVPTGNFGNICAGHVARQMGLPIGLLVLATNENDVLDEFFRTGTPVPGAQQPPRRYETSSPSMDISKASNFERFIFDALDRDGEANARALRRGRGIRADLLAGRGRARAPCKCFRSEQRAQHGRRPAGDDPRRVSPLRRGHRSAHRRRAEGRPRARPKKGTPMIVLETALAAKFNATVREALGTDAPRPPRFAGIESLPRRYTTLPIDLGRLKALIAENS